SRSACLPAGRPRAGPWRACTPPRRGRRRGGPRPRRRPARPSSRGAAASPGPGGPARLRRWSAPGGGDSGGSSGHPRVARGLAGHVERCVEPAPQVREGPGVRRGTGRGVADRLHEPGFLPLDWRLRGWGQASGPARWERQLPAGPSYIWGRAVGAERNTVTSFALGHLASTVIRQRPYVWVRRVSSRTGSRPLPSRSGLPQSLQVLVSDIRVLLVGDRPLGVLEDIPERAGSVGVSIRVVTC